MKACTQLPLDLVPSVKTPQHIFTTVTKAKATWLAEQQLLKM